MYMAVTYEHKGSVALSIVLRQACSMPSTLWHAFATLMQCSNISPAMRSDVKKQAQDPG
jgi:hypothetical protein